MVNYKRVVGVAQLVERRSVAPNVAGSIPVSHPNFSTENKTLSVFPSLSSSRVGAQLLHTALRGPPRTGQHFGL